MPSLLNRLILKGSINNWINQWVWHPEEEDTRLKVLAHWFIYIREHKNEHHSVVGKPTYDDYIHDAEKREKRKWFTSIYFPRARKLNKTHIPLQSQPISSAISFSPCESISVDLNHSVACDRNACLSSYDRLLVWTYVRYLFYTIHNILF